MKYIPISELSETTSASDSDMIAIDNGTKTSKISVGNYNSNANATAKSYAEASAGSAAESATSAENAEKQAESAQKYSAAAAESATNASASKDSASQYASNAASQANSAKTYASSASTSAGNASTSANNASDSATLSKSWAVGGTNTRDGENTNNAKYWSQVAAGAAAGGVLTFNGRNGAVVPQSGDYSASLISRGTSDVNADLTKLETGLASETTRAKAAESGNASAIANEVTRAKAAEESNANAITVETTRAKSAETKFANLHSTAKITVNASGTWTNATINGASMYTYSIPLTAVYADIPTISLAASGTNIFPTAEEQKAYSLVQYVTVDSDTKTLKLYVTAVPTSDFVISVEGVKA